MLQELGEWFQSKWYRWLIIINDLIGRSHMLAGAWLGNQPWNSDRLLALSPRVYYWMYLYHLWGLDIQEKISFNIILNFHFKGIPQSWWLVVHKTQQCCVYRLISLAGVTLVKVNICHRRGQSWQKKRVGISVLRQYTYNCVMKSLKFWFINFY